MARARNRTPSPAQRAGEAYNRLQPAQALPDARVPIITGQYDRYRYIVTIEYRSAVTGDQQYRSVVVTSDRRLTRDEVLSDAEATAQGRIGTDAYQLSVWGDYYVEESGSTVTYAARNR